MAGAVGILGALRLAAVGRRSGRGCRSVGVMARLSPFGGLLRIPLRAPRTPCNAPARVFRDLRGDGQGGRRDGCACLREPAEHPSGAVLAGAGRRRRRFHGAPAARRPSRICATRRRLHGQVAGAEAVPGDLPDAVPGSAGTRRASDACPRWMRIRRRPAQRSAAPQCSRSPTTAAEARLRQQASRLVFKPPRGRARARSPVPWTFLRSAEHMQKYWSQLRPRSAAETGRAPRACYQAAHQAVPDRLGAGTCGRGGGRSARTRRSSLCLEPLSSVYRKGPRRLHGARTWRPCSSELAGPHRRRPTAAHPLPARTWLPALAAQGGRTARATPSSSSSSSTPTNAVAHRRPTVSRAKLLHGTTELRQVLCAGILGAARRDSANLRLQRASGSSRWRVACNARHLTPSRDPPTT